MLSIKNRIEMETTVKLYSLNYSNVKTYLFALLFVAAILHYLNCVIWCLPVVLPYCLFTFSH